MRRKMNRLLALGLALALTLPLAACKSTGDGGQSQAPQPSQNQTQPSATPTPTPTPEPVDPYDAVRNYWSEDQLTHAWGPNQPVEHLFFHPVIAYPEYTFSSAISKDRQDVWTTGW